jgi:hypothetical protein
MLLYALETLQFCTATVSMHYYSNPGDNQRVNFGNSAWSVEYNYLAHKLNFNETQVLKQDL